MPITVVTLTVLNDDVQAELEEYLNVVMPLVKAAGGAVVTRYEHIETVLGTPVPQFVTIVHYPTRAAVDDVFKHPDFLALKELHKRVFQRYDLSIMHEARL